jgi:hypothetical protein
MKTVLKGLTTAALFAAAMTAPASAQTKSWGFGVHGAYFKSGTLAKNETTNDASAVRLQMDNNSMWGGNLEYWFPGARWGLRGNFDYSKSMFIYDRNTDDDAIPDESFDDDETDAVGLGDNSIYAGDANIMLRLLSPTPDRRFAPFLSLGGGWMTWDQATDGQSVDIQLPTVDAQIQGNSQSEPVVTGSIGTDIFFTDNIALRLEAKDYWNPASPYLKLSELGNSADAEGARHHDGTHNGVFSAGFSFLFGGRPVVEPGFIAEAPAPPPPPPPAPAKPTTEQVAMCTVNANGQLEMVNATRDLGTREIFVTRNGQRSAFVTAYPANDPYYVQNSSWYVSSRPLIISLEPTTGTRTDATVELPANRIELVNFGSTTPMMSNDLVWVGSVHGTPLYAKRADVSSDLMPDLTAKLRTSGDLEVVLGDSAFADRYTAGIPTFYMAVAPGENECTFQPVSSTRVVRRTRG